MRKLKSFILVITLLSMSVISCDKQNKVVVNNTGQEQEKYIPNNSYDYTTMQDIFKSIDIPTFQNALENEDTVDLMNEMVVLADKIHFFLNSNYDTFTVCKFKL